MKDFRKQSTRRLLKRNIYGLISVLLFGVLFHLVLQSKFPLSENETILIEFVNPVVLLLLVLFFGCFSYFCYLIEKDYYLPLAQLLSRAEQVTTQLNRVDEVSLDSEIQNLSHDEPEEITQLEKQLRLLTSEFNASKNLLQTETEKVRALLEALTSAIIAVDNEMKVLFYNPAFAELVPEHAISPGVTTLRELIRKPAVIETFEHVINQGTPDSIDVNFRKEPIKQDFFYHLSIAPIISKQQANQPLGTIGVFHDISELKLAEKIRVDFVGNVSHELRNPLTSINGYLQIMEDDLKAENFKELKNYLKVARRNVNRLVSLVKDLLELSTLDSGIELEKSVIALADCTNHIIQEFNKAIQTKQQTIDVQYSIDTIQADSTRVEQVLANLLDNAIKYSPEGSTIQIHWSADSHWNKLTVIDNGPGIAEEHLPRLFERFYRADKSRSRNLGGTGLGLAIVKHIVQAHGGYVEVDSKIDKGSQFICLFPKHLENDGLT